jgi:hypothetical protein
MSRPACPAEITEAETTPDQITVAVPYETVVDLIELLGLVGALCRDRRPAIDATIAGLAGNHTHCAAALAARSTAMAWALAATVWPDSAGECTP